MSQTIQIEYKGSSLRISYLVREEKERDPFLVFLHGLGCAKDDFLPAFSREEIKKYSLLVFDLPGFGESPLPKNQKYSVEDYAEITALLLQKLNIQNPIFIAHSMGGRIAHLIAKKYPHSLSGIMSVEGNIHRENCIFSGKVYKSSFSHFKENIFPKLIEKCSQSENKGFQYYSKILKKYHCEEAFFHVCPSLVEGSHENLVEEFINFPVPKIYTKGSENTFSYLSDLENSSCKVVEISNSNHFPYIDNPNFFYKILSRFLNSLHREDKPNP